MLTELSYKSTSSTPFVREIQTIAATQELLKYL